MKKKKDSLLFKFAGIFMIFTVITMLMSLVNTYISQTRTYKDQCEANIRSIAAYLEEMVRSDGMEFLYLQNYFMEHSNDMRIPYDFSGNTDDAWEKYEKLFEEKYPDKVLGIDIEFDELSEDVKLAYAVYNYEYYLNIFEKARTTFDLAYTYYMVPTEQARHVVMMIDGVRAEKIIDGRSYLNLGTDVYQNPKEHATMWEAWDTGKSPKGYDKYNNEFGKTYAYYTPLVIGGKKIGIIGTEIYVDMVGRVMFMNAVKQSAGMGIIMLICMLVMLMVINKRYISRIRRLEYNVRAYTTEKSPVVAGLIEKDAVGNDELSSLSHQLSAMIIELEDYIKTLTKTSRELSTTQHRASEMNEIAYKDALTGMKNKAAYDNEVRRIKWKIDDGYTKFGIAMIDLNFLKRINDTYGHKQGDAAIKGLCDIVCTIFPDTDIYRIGGDEFVIILEDDNYENAEALMEEFNRQIEKTSTDESLAQWERISAAIGVALYDPEKDHSVANVFKRADKEMYRRKKEMKAVRL